MKKSYITPDLKAIRLCSAALLQGSPLRVGIYYDENVDDESKSNSYQGGLLWEEDAQ